MFDHVFPLALPGMLTGSIIGMARALGESAPLLMIGMVAFVVDVPSSPLDSSAALPVQVYLWAMLQRGFRGENICSNFSFVILFIINEFDSNLAQK